MKNKYDDPAPVRRSRLETELTHRRHGFEECFSSAGGPAAATSSSLMRLLKASPSLLDSASLDSRSPPFPRGSCFRVRRLIYASKQLATFSIKCSIFSRASRKVCSASADCVSSVGLLRNACSILERACRSKSSAACDSSDRVCLSFHILVIFW